MSYKKMHIRHFFLLMFFSYESCFGNNIVTTSVNLPLLSLGAEVTPSLSSQPWIFYLFIFSVSAFLLPLKSK